MRLYHVTIPLSILFAGAGFYLALANRPAPPAGPVHPVTDDMRKKSERMGLKTAPDFNLRTPDGKAFTLAQATGGKPTLLYFVLKGCPCSIEAEPMIQKLAKHHGDKMNLVAVINVGLTEAKHWIADNNVSHLLLCDPTLGTMRAYDSPNSVYTTLIAPDGKIEKQWPGWSKKILQEQNTMLAKLTGQPEKPFDTEYAPIEDSSGCNFAEHAPKPTK